MGTIAIGLLVGLEYTGEAMGGDDGSILSSLAAQRHKEGLFVSHGQ